MISRRSFLIVLAGSGLAGAQSTPTPAPKSARIGILTLRGRESAAAWLFSFRDAVREIGTPLSVELRFADGDPARLPTLSKELVQRGVQALVATDEPSFRAAKGAAARVPLVPAAIATPVDLAPRQLELLMSVRPKLMRMAVLMNPKNSTHKPYFNVLGSAAQKKGVRVLGVEVERADDLPSAFEDMRMNRVGAFAVAPDGLFSQEEVHIGALGRQYRLPSMAPHPTFVNVGCLMSYGDHAARRFHALATDIEEVLKGRTAPYDVYRPEQIPLVVNRTTARIIGVRLPQQIVKEASIVE